MVRRVDRPNVPLVQLDGSAQPLNQVEVRLQRSMKRSRTVGAYRILLIFIFSTSALLEALDGADVGTGKDK